MLKNKYLERREKMKRFKHCMKCILPLLLAFFVTSNFTLGSASYALENVDKSYSIEQTNFEKQEVENDLQTQEDVPAVDEPSPSQEEEQPVPEDEMISETPSFEILTLPNPQRTPAVPEHTKRITGNKTLTLDVVGATNTIHGNKPKIDLLLVIDQSTTMSEHYKMKHLKDVVTNPDDGLTKNFLENSKFDAQMAVMTFEGTYTNLFEPASDDAFLISDWTNNKATVDREVMKIEPKGGTNYQSGLRFAKTILQSSRADAQKFMIFLSDGGTEGMIDENGNHIYVDNADVALDHAIQELKSIKGLTGFYTIAFTHDPDSNTGMELRQHLKDLQISADAPKKNSYLASNADELLEQFKDIVSNITNAFSNVTITDTLSDLVDLSNAKIEIDGTLTNAVVKIVDETVTPPKDVTDVEKAAAGIRVTYDKDKRQVTMDFDDAYQLKQEYRYSVSFDIEPNKAAYDKYIADGKVYPKDTNYSCGGNGEGYYTNAGASLSFAYGSDKETNSQISTVPYDGDNHPVVKVDNPITVVKVWQDVNGNKLSENLPESLRVKLDYEDASYPGEEIVLTKDGQWQGEFKTLLNTKFTIDESEVPDGFEKVSAEFGKTDNFIITNKQIPSHALTIKKVVNGVFGDSKKTFNIIVTTEDKNYNENGFVNGSKTIPLKHNESLTISGLPANSKYVIKEEAESSKGYEVSYSGTVEDSNKSTPEFDCTLNKDITVTVTNTRNLPIDAGVDNTPLGFMGVVISGLVISILGVLKMKRRYL